MYQIPKKCYRDQRHWSEILVPTRPSARDPICLVLLQTGLQNLSDQFSELASNRQVSLDWRHNNSSLEYLSSVLIVSVCLGGRQRVQPGSLDHDPDCNYSPMLSFMKGKFRITQEWNYIFWESTIPSVQIAGYRDFSLTTCTVLFRILIIILNLPWHHNSRWCWIRIRISDVDLSCTNDIQNGIFKRTRSTCIHPRYFKSQCQIRNSRAA